MLQSNRDSRTNLPRTRNDGSLRLLVWVILGSFALATLMAPLAKLAMEATLAADTSRYDFGRVYRRLSQLGAVALLLLWWRPMRLGARIRLGLSPSSTGWRDLGAGVGIALVAVAVFLIAGSLEGSFVASRRTLSAGALLQALYLATIVALTEEIQFNCIALDILRERMPAWLAITLRSLLFSALHLLRVRVYVEVASGGGSIARGFDPTIGFEVLYRAATSFQSGQWIDVVAEHASLFLLAVASSIAYLRTRRLFLSLGLHWGLVFALRMDGYVVRASSEVSPWFHSHHAVFASPAGLIVLVLLLLTVARVARRSPDQLEPSAGALGELT